MPSPHPCPKGLRKGSLNRPAIIESRVNNTGVYAQTFCPSGHAKPNAVMLKVSGVPFIARIHDSSNPVTVVRAINTIIVLTIYFMFWGGTFAHVVIKVWERLSPLRTSPNTPCAIPMVVRIAFTRTSTDHALPNSVDWRTFHSMSRKPFPRYFPSIAAATLGITGSQRLALEHTPRATITNTIPVGLTVVSFREFKNSKSAKTLTGNILETSIFRHRIGTGHDSYLQYELCSRAA